MLQFTLCYDNSLLDGIKIKLEDYGVEFEFDENEECIKIKSKGKTVKIGYGDINKLIKIFKLIENLDRGD